MALGGRGAAGAMRGKARRRRYERLLHSGRGAGRARRTRHWREHRGRVAAALRRCLTRRCEARSSRPARSPAAIRRPCDRDVAARARAGVSRDTHRDFTTRCRGVGEGDRRCCSSPLREFGQRDLVSSAVSPVSAREPRCRNSTAIGSALEGRGTSVSARPFTAAWASFFACRRRSRLLETLRWPQSMATRCSARLAGPDRALRASVGVRRPRRAPIRWRLPIPTGRRVGCARSALQCLARHGATFGLMRTVMTVGVS